MVTHIVPEYTIGEKCSQCGNPASHKVAEEARMVFDKPGQVVRHAFTTYLCCRCFSALMGLSASEACGLTKRALDKGYSASQISSLTLEVLSTQEAESQTALCK